MDDPGDDVLVDDGFRAGSEDSVGTPGEGGGASEFSRMREEEHIVIDDPGDDLLVNDGFAAVSGDSL